ncbi:MAG: DUF4383 domain-containing protein [Bacillota bacterium]
MEPELERKRPTTPQKPEAGSQSQQPVEKSVLEPLQGSEQFERRTYAREVCTVLGVLLLSVGFVGMVVDDFLTLHLSYVHNLIHMVSGALAIWFGVHSEAGAKRFSYLFGTLYTVLGVLGFVVGVRGVASIGEIKEDSFLWIISPGRFELGTNDHVIHLLIGIAFLAAGLIMFKRRRWEPSTT